MNSGILKFRCNMFGHQKSLAPVGIALYTLNHNTHATPITLPIYSFIYIGDIVAKKIAHKTATYKISEH